MRLFRALALTGTLLSYALATLGSWTRINGAGMACPDWPLCHGSVIPVLSGGVMLEWLHRAVALLVSFLVLALIAAGLRVRSRSSAITPLIGALAAVIVLQVVLGGVTIFASNSPASVTMHWGTAMLLLAVLTALTVVAFASGESDDSVLLNFSSGTWPLFATVIATLAAMCAGAYVSSSRAGLACLGFPACGATVLGETAAQTAQMLHRLLAVLAALCAVAAALLLPPQARAARLALRAGLALLALQIVLGALNVEWALPSLLREAHAANAGAAFIAFVVAMVLVSLRRTPAALQATAVRPGDPTLRRASEPSASG